MNNAALFSECNIFQQQNILRCLKKYGELMKWKPKAAVLDIGCGDGSATANVIGTEIPCSELIGCDKSQEMVDYARSHFSSSLIHFERYDITHPVPSKWVGHFQHVVSFLALHWVHEHEIAYKNIYNLMGTVGTCLLVPIGEHSLYDAYRILSKMDKWSPWIKDVEQFISPYHDWVDPISKVKDILVKTGFGKHKIHYEKLSYSYDNINLLRGSYKAVSPFKIPEDRWDEYIDDLFQQMHILDTEKYDYPKSVLDGVLNMKLVEIFVEK